MSSIIDNLIYVIRTRYYSFYLFFNVKDLTLLWSILKRPVRPPALSALIIKLAASDDGESALARVMREISRLELAWEEKRRNRRKKGMRDYDSPWLFRRIDNG